MVLKNSIRFSIYLLVILPLGINAQNPAPKGEPDSVRTDIFLKDLLKQYPQYFDSATGMQQLNVQVIYTKIDRGANGIAGLKHYYFNVNASGYFCPGTTIALPVAMLTLQKLAELKTAGVDKNTTMLTEKAYNGQTAVYNDPTTPNGKPSIAQYLKKMLMTGDEDACNRLYEFLGQQYINSQLQQRGYTNVRVTRRLNIDLSEDENRHTNPVRFLAPGNKLIYDQAAQYNTNPSAENLTKNRLSLEDLHTMLVSLVFPNKITAAQRFTINEEDRKYILKYMSQLPVESFNPPYSDDTTNYYPAYNKFLLYGAGKDTITKSIRVFNVASESDGQIIDAAYIADFDKKIEFMLSAAIDCGEDKYETMALPFMRHLGEVIYEYETKREKSIQPDLEGMKMIYDGR